MTDSIPPVIERAPELLPDSKSVRFLINLFFLLGVGLLWASSWLGWWNDWRYAAFHSAVPVTGAISFPAFFVKHGLDVAKLLTAIAGAAGFFFWLFPQNKSSRHMRGWIYLPASVGILFGFTAILVMPAMVHSTVTPWGDTSIWTFTGMARLVANGGAGLHFGLSGLMGIALAACVARAKRCSLADLLGPAWSPSVYEERSWRRFVWLAVTVMCWVSVSLGFALLPLLIFLLAVIRGLVLAFGVALHFQMSSPLLLFAVALLLLMLVAMGKEWRQTLRSSLRLPYPEYPVVAFLMPVCVFHLGEIAATFYSGSERGTNFHMWQVPLSNLVFLLLPLALVEEIGWRGYLQPRLIARFGPFWGIFCVGVVWSAFHFSEDLHLNQTDAAAIRFLFGRVVGGIAIGFFLSWLTLRSRSVWPAAIAHAAINGLNFRFYYTSLCIWILVDVVLFFIWRPFRRKVKAIAQGGRERELIGEKFSPS